VPDTPKRALRSLPTALLLAVVALVLALGAAVPAGAQTDAVSKAKKEVEAAKAAATKARSRANDIAKTAQAAAKELTEALSGVQRLTDEIATAEKAITEAEAEETVLKNRVASRAVSLYKQAGGDATSDETIETVDSDGLAEQRKAVLASTVTRRDADVADEWRASAVVLGEKKAQLAEDRAALEAEQSELEAQKRAVDAQLAAAQKAADEANAAAAREVEALKAAEKQAADNKRAAEAARLAQERANAEARARTGGTGSSSGGSAGGIRCPIAGAVTFYNDWGQPRSGGRGHGGTDLLSAKGTPNVAVVSGTIMQQTESLGGISVYLIGDNGYTYYYTHLSGYGASGRVTAGTVIGYTGNTGNASGGVTHTHFEIRKGGPNGAKSNPYPILAAVC
jgi:murein DD-endopeptidase MepM/ murein hydrolase activator NlpD